GRRAGAELGGGSRGHAGRGRRLLRFRGLAALGLFLGQALGLLLGALLRLFLGLGLGLGAGAHRFLGLALVLFFLLTAQVFLETRRIDGVAALGLDVGTDRPL